MRVLHRTIATRIAICGLSVVAVFVLDLFTPWGYQSGCCMACCFFSCESTRHGITFTPLRESVPS